MRPTREGPYRQAASSDDPPRGRQPLRAAPIATLAIALLLLAAPVVALATQPFSFYATLVTGAFAAWTAIALIRIGGATV